MAAAGSSSGAATGGGGESMEVPKFAPEVSLEDYSPVQRARLSAKPDVPASLETHCAPLIKGDTTTSLHRGDHEALEEALPLTFGQPLLKIGTSAGAAAAARGGGTAALKVAVVFCGRQSPGGHNVCAGLHDALRAANPDSVLYGAVGGTVGFFAGNLVEITEEMLAKYRNQGGYHMLGRSVDQIRTPEHQASALAVVKARGLDALVMIGGTYTATDAGHLAEFFAKEGAEAGPVAAVVGVPVSIDNDFPDQFVESSLGFDTATKVYSQLVGNMATDAASARKYTMFIRLMGRKASHIAMECAMQTRPNVVLLGEEIEHRKMTLAAIVSELADTVATRSAAGKDFSVVLVPEGVIEYIPELRTLIEELNGLVAKGHSKEDDVTEHLTPWSKAVLGFLPAFVRKQLLLERESHGTVQLSQISTEKLLAELVGDELDRRKGKGAFGGKYSVVTHFFGYQSRSSLPSCFDCNLGYSLGLAAASLASSRSNGYLATIQGQASGASTWQALGVPITALMAIKDTPRGRKPVVPSVPVDVSGRSFRSLRKGMAEWKGADDYSNPGPIQFSGRTRLSITQTLATDRHDYMRRIEELKKHLAFISETCKPGVSDALLGAALTGVRSLTEILGMIAEHD